MKRTLLVAAVIMASVGASIAEQEAVSPEQKRDIETIAQKYFDAINTDDAQRAASFFQTNGFVVGLSGMIRTQGLANYFDKVHKMGAKVTLVVENIEPVAGGKAVILTGNFTATFTSAPEAKGVLVQLYEQEGSDWKLRASVAARMGSTLVTPAVSEKMKQ
jgi:ketosteroid isomerase-like protein